MTDLRDSSDEDRISERLRGGLIRGAADTFCFLCRIRNISGYPLLATVTYRYVLRSPTTHTFHIHTAALNRPNDFDVPTPTTLLQPLFAPVRLRFLLLS